MKEALITPLTYQAGDHIFEIQKKFGFKQVIKLASNENPYGPSPLALAALHSTLNLNRYPDEKNLELRKTIAQKFQIDTDRILISNGTTQLIDTIVRAFCSPKDEILLFEKTFIYYKISAYNHQIPCCETPRGGDFEYQLNALTANIKPNTKIVFLAAPDNPTGVYISKESVKSILMALPKKALLVFDEAYREYVPPNSYFDPIEIQDPRLLILRTFSKIYGLAGLRCGYAIAAPELIARLSQIQAPFSVSTVSQAAAIAAIQDQSHIEFVKSSNHTEMENFKEILIKNNIQYINSYGNFIMINTATLDGESVYHQLISVGIIVRPLKMYGLHNFLRITIGLPKENEIFIQHLLKIIKP